MANIKSAIKRVNTNNTKRSRNQSVKSDMRTNMKQVEQFVEANDVDNAKAQLNKTVKVIDRASQKGVIHKNAATRYKTKLTHKVSAMNA